MAQCGINTFKEGWLFNSRFKDWIIKESATSAKCRWCRKVVDLRNMGITALTSQLKCKKHKQLQKDFSEGKLSRLCFKPKQSLVNNSFTTSGNTKKNETIWYIVIPFSTEIR